MSRTDTAPAPGSWRRRLRGWRGPAAVVTVVVAATLAGLLLVRPTGAGALDPDSPAPDGARAVVRVLGDQGVAVRDLRSFDAVRRAVEAASGRVTLVLARPDRLAPGRAAQLSRLVDDPQVDLVVVGADNGVLTDLALPVGAAPAGAARVVEPACDSAGPARAGSALAGEVTYSRNDALSGRPVTDSVGCYPVDGRSAYLELTHPGGATTVLLGSGAALTNDRLADAGDAALSLAVLGRDPDVLWWTPDPLDGPPTDEPASLVSLLPDGVLFAGVQLLVVLLVVVLWRGRRLGPLVREPLPVVVRAVETTLGRARLYRRARARGRAAQVLRAAASRRLAVRCGLPRTAPLEQVVTAVSAASGLPAVQVGELLVGPDPHDDPSLVQLARGLQTLEREAHRP